MAAPWGALSMGLVASITEVEEDVDGRAPGEALPVGLATSTTKVEEDVNGRPLGDATGGSGSIHHRG
jgi:hypothetical protein